MLSPELKLAPDNDNANLILIWPQSFSKKELEDAALPKMPVLKS